MIDGPRVICDIVLHICWLLLLCLSNECEIMHLSSSTVLISLALSLGVASTVSELVRKRTEGVTVIAYQTNSPSSRQSVTIGGLKRGTGNIRD